MQRDQAGAVATARSLMVNGVSLEHEQFDPPFLADFLRAKGFTEVKVSCGVQSCGACTVIVDDRLVSSCCFLVGQCYGRQVRTIGHLRGSETFRALEEAFVEQAGVQCGFCTPGIITTAWFLITHGSLTRDIDDEALAALMAGNICRCTGYQPVLRAIRAVLDASAGRISVTGMNQET